MSTRTYPAADASAWIDAALDSLGDADDEVIVDRDGEPTFAIVSITVLEELRALREEKVREEGLRRLYEIRDERERNGIVPIPSTATPEQRAEAWARLEALREEVSARNADLTEEQIEEISVKMSRDMIDHMAETGKIVFERDLRKRR